MIGRLDDYLTEVAEDNRAPVSAADIQQAGLAVTKRAYALYKERGYEAVLLVAALRGNYHMTELAGAELIMSIHPRNQGQLHAAGRAARSSASTGLFPRTSSTACAAMPEFVRAYEPDGMKPEDFVSFGVTQRTLSQFSEAGWMLLESFKL